MGTDQRVTGFREPHRRLAENQVGQGDVFLCYLTRLSRWCGVLEVESDVYRDDSPIFGDPDPFTVRYNVRPVVVLDLEQAIPIYEDEVWGTLSFTNQHEKGSSVWTGFVRGSLNRFTDSDGSYLAELLRQQQTNQQSYPLTDKDKRKLARKSKVRALSGRSTSRSQTAARTGTDRPLALAAKGHSFWGVSCSWLVRETRRSAGASVGAAGVVGVARAISVGGLSAG
ncbi:MAG: hypothetical protein OXG37_12900 [Actinomycetia bacterium]|nr:hypothetical protein [Actinomycetes bacterium]